MPDITGIIAFLCLGAIFVSPIIANELRRAHKSGW